MKEELLNEIIKQEEGGFVIYSHKGKKLSKVYKSEEQAKKRLRQIEAFKHMKGGSNASKKFGKNVTLYDLVGEIKAKGKK